MRLFSLRGLAFLAALFTLCTYTNVHYHHEATFYNTADANSPSSPAELFLKRFAEAGGDFNRLEPRVITTAPSLLHVELNIANVTAPSSQQTDLVAQLPPVSPTEPPKALPKALLPFYAHCRLTCVLNTIEQDFFAIIWDNMRCCIFLYI